MVPQVLAMIATRGPDTQKLVTSHCSALLAADPKSTVDTLVSGSSFLAQSFYFLSCFLQIELGGAVSLLGVNGEPGLLSSLLVSTADKRPDIATECIR